MKEFSKEERASILTEIKNSPLSDIEKWILEAALCPRACPVCSSSDVSSNGEVRFVFQTVASDDIEKEINESGLATVCFRADSTRRPGCVIHCIKVEFTRSA